MGILCFTIPTPFNNQQMIWNFLNTYKCNSEDIQTTCILNACLLNLALIHDQCHVISWICSLIKLLDECSLKSHWNLLSWTQNLVSIWWYSIMQPIFIANYIMHYLKSQCILLSMLLWPSITLNLDTPTYQGSEGIYI